MYAHDQALTILFSQVVSKFVKLNPAKNISYTFSIIIIPLSSSCVMIVIIYCVVYQKLTVN